MYTDWLTDGRVYALLQRCDEDLAAEQRARGCPRCGGALHAAHYPRKPRGGPPGLDPEYGRRLSYCCAREGCRKRATPPSLRFLGRKVYLAAVVVLVSAMCNGPTPARMQFLQARTGVSRRTVLRWRRWWSQGVTATPWWRAAAGRLMPPVTVARLPGSLLERFAGSALERLCALLRFLAPLTSASATVHAA